MTTLEKLNKQIRFENGNLGSISIAGKTDLWFADVEKETKKEKIVRMLKNDDSYDIIAMRCDCEVSYVKKIEKEYERLRI